MIVVAPPCSASDGSLLSEAFFRRRLTLGRLKLDFDILLWHRFVAINTVCLKMKNAKKLFKYASTENMSRGPDIAERMLVRFARGDLSKLKEFLFNAAIDVREITDQKPFNKAVGNVSNREMLEASQPTGRIATSFNETEQSVTLHVYHQQQGSEVQNSLVARHSAALLAVTYAALGVDMQGLIDLSDEDLFSQNKTEESASAEDGDINVTGE